MHSDTTPYVVNVTTHHDHPLDDTQLEELAELGGAVTAGIGDTRSYTAVNIDLRHDDPIEIAAGDAIRLVQKIALGDTVAVEVLTVDELERRLAEPAFPELVGIAEIATMLDITRQRASALQTRQGFPAPVAVLRSGPVWRKGDLTRFADTWQRTPGRPRKHTA